MQFIFNSPAFLNIALRGCGFISLLLIFKIFDKAAVGLFSTYVLYGAMFGSLVLLGSEQSLLKRRIYKSAEFGRAALFYVLFAFFSMIIAVGLLVLNFIEFNLILLFMSMALYSAFDKYYEAASKFQANYDVYLRVQIAVSLLGVLYIIALGLLQYNGLELSFRDLLAQKVVVLVALVVMSYKSVLVFFFYGSVKSSLSSLLDILRNDFGFILLLVVASLFSQSERVLISLVVSSERFADFSLLSSFLALIYSVKIVFSNKYLYLIKHPIYFMRISRKLAFRYTAFIGCICFFLYYVTVSVFLEGYDFLFLPFFLGFVFILFESAIGPSATVISYIGDPAVGAAIEFFVLCLVVVSSLLYWVLEAKFEPILFFVSLVFFAKAISAFIKLWFVKSRGLYRAKDISAVGSVFDV